MVLDVRLGLRLEGKCVMEGDGMGRGGRGRGRGEGEEGGEKNKVVWRRLGVHLGKAVRRTWKDRDRKKKKLTESNRFLRDGRNICLCFFKPFIFILHFFPQTLKGSPSNPNLIIL